MMFVFCKKRPMELARPSVRPPSASPAGLQKGHTFSPCAASSSVSRPRAMKHRVSPSPTSPATEWQYTSYEGTSVVPCDPGGNGGVAAWREGVRGRGAGGKRSGGCGFLPHVDRDVVGHAVAHPLRDVPYHPARALRERVEHARDGSKVLEQLLLGTLADTVHGPRRRAECLGRKGAQVRDLRGGRLRCSRAGSWTRAGGFATFLCSAPLKACMSSSMVSSARSTR